VLTTPAIHIDPALRRRVAPRVLGRLARRARASAQVLSIGPARWATLGLRVVDDAQMSALHLRYMGEAGPTDVLSFAPDALAPDPIPALGDIAIDWDAVVRQARGPGPRAQLDEATILLVHGLAHLLGHDHRDRREGRAMARVEATVLRRLGVPDQARPYAPRLRARPPESGAARR